MEYCLIKLQMAVMSLKFNSVNVLYNRFLQRSYLIIK